MGLAASQARFLGLTARKSNVEYEGQQVNQQRTALANESASLYTQLTSLKVPTPPDVTQYYKTEYSFTFNGKSYTMTSLPLKNGTSNTYTLGLSYDDYVSSFKELSSNSGIDFSNITDNQTLSDYPDLQTFINKGKNANEQLGNDTQVKAIASNNNFYYLVNGKTYQHFQNQVTNNIISTKSQVTYNEDGNITSVLVPEIGDMEEAISVSSKSVQDTDAYDLAMETYSQEKAAYEKKMAEINNKTEVIQQQDKTLELRLNQLDTEQNAISTEMDAVTKVIEKNVEKTFKTFA